jgi:hypothetical protein
MILFGYSATSTIERQRSSDLRDLRRRFTQPLYAQQVERESMNSVTVPRSAGSGSSPARRAGAKAAKQRRAPSFLASFSKSSVFLSKLFQTFLWLFCGISRCCKPKNINDVAPNFLWSPASVQSYSRRRNAAFHRPRAACARAFSPSPRFTLQLGINRIHSAAIQIARISNLADISVSEKKKSVIFSVATVEAP